MADLIGRRRSYGAIRSALGAVVLSDPDRALALVAVPERDHGARRAVLALAVRDVVQGLASVAAPGPRVLRLGRRIDALHAVSMAGLATRPGRLRRAALLSGAAAVGWWALAGALVEDDDRRVGPPPARRELATRAVATRQPRSGDDPPSASYGDDRRHTARLQQRVIDEVLQAHGGEPAATLVPRLRDGLRAAGLVVPPEPWLDAVAMELAGGRIYVVSSESLDGDPDAVVALHRRIAAARTTPQRGA